MGRYGGPAKQRRKQEKKVSERSRTKHQPPAERDTKPSPDDYDIARDAACNWKPKPL